MTQDCSLLSSTAGVDNVHNVHNVHSDRRLPNGIHIAGADDASASGVGEMSKNKEDAPWGYIFIRHMSADCFEKRLNTQKIEGDFRPRCFVHRTVRYKKKPDGKGIMKEEKPTFSGLVFLQGSTVQLRSFLIRNFPQCFLVNNCSTGRPASIPDSLMRPFMAVTENAPGRVTFLRTPFVKFAKDHVKLRVLTGPFKNHEGYVIRIKRDRQLVMDFGGYTVAISGVHNEDFEVAE